MANVLRTPETRPAYIPLRVHSIFSRGNGAVSPSVLADRLAERNINHLAVSDLFTVIGWEAFRKTATQKSMVFMPGLEIKIKNGDSVVIYPKNREGYAAIVSSFNRKKFVGLHDCILIYLSGQTDKNSAIRNIGHLMNHQEDCDLYIGLEWNSSSWIQALCTHFQSPPVWAQSVKWIDNPEKYRVAYAVFKHYPIQDINPSGVAVKNGLIHESGIIKRWNTLGRQAMQNSFALAEQVDFDFSEPNQNRPNPTDNQRLAKRVETALREKHSNDREQRRAYLELARIKEMGFANYFLIAAEIADFCKKNGIYFNTRGSGASSYILYLMGISKVNPLKYNLLFERFVNRMREALPDIDIDIESSRRPEVLKWVFGHYRTRTAFISTHKYFGARSALYEVLRAYGHSPEDAHKYSKGLSPFSKPAELMGKGNGHLKPIYDHAALLDGVYKELSVHLGGVIFSPADIEETFPAHYSPDNFRQVIWDKDSIERLMIYKLDLLGVRGFDLISSIARSGHTDFTNRAVWERIRAAKTIGCFQMESPLAMDALKQTQPANLFELGISIAIIRPGPAKSGMKAQYIQKRMARGDFLFDLFPNSRGSLIFEEQISVLLHAITGWDLEFSEKVRRDLKKKRGDQHRLAFFEKGSYNGWSSEDLERFWKLAADFSLYAFNQAHSVSYAYSAYVSAWFKTRYPVAFFCRLLNSGGGSYPLPF